MVNVEQCGFALDLQIMDMLGIQSIFLDLDMGNTILIVSF